MKNCACYKIEPTKKPNFNQIMLSSSMRMKEEIGKKEKFFFQLGKRDVIFDIFTELFSHLSDETVPKKNLDTHFLFYGKSKNTKNVFFGWKKVFLREK